MPREKLSYPAPDSDCNKRRFYENPVQLVKSKSLKRWCNYERRPAQVFEVAFDGAWDPVPAQMTMHLTIDEK